MHLGPASSGRRWLVFAESQCVGTPQVLPTVGDTLTARGCATALDAMACESDREAHPAWLRRPAQSLRASYELLDMLGWAVVTPAVPARIDLQGRRGTRSGGALQVRWCAVRFLAVAQAQIDSLAVKESGEYAESPPEPSGTLRVTQAPGGGLDRAIASRSSTS
jgi:hypothetical protein